MRRWIPCLCLAVVVAIFFGRAALRGETLYYDDLPYQFYPWKALLRVAGHVTLWLPWEYSGVPHQADIQRQLLYPPNLIFFAVDTAPAMVIFVGFHLLAAGICMMVLLRALDDEAPPAALFCAAIVYAFGAFVVLHSSQLSQLASCTWLPLLVAACVHSWRAMSYRWIVVGALALALMIYGGAPQAVYIGLCFCVLVHGACAFERRGAGGRGALVALGWMVFLGLGLASAQLLPSAEFAARTVRASSVETTSPAPMLATLLSPYFRGNPHERTWSGEYTFHETCLYLGLVTLMLGVSALTGGARARLLCAIAALGLGLALGPQLGTFYEMLVTFMPGFGRFRVASRWSLMTALAAACLAGLGTAQIMRSGRARGIAAATAVAVVGGAVAVGGASPLCLCAAVVAGIAALLAGRFPSAASAVIALALGLDLVLGFAARYVVFSEPPQPQRDYPPLATLPAQTTDGARVVGSADMGVPSGFLPWFSVYGIAGVQGNNPLYLQNYVDFLYVSQTGQMAGAMEGAIQQHNGLFPIGVQNAMTRMLNIAFMVRGRGGEGGADPFGRVPVMLTLDVREAEDPCGEAWAAARWAVVPEHADRLLRMVADDFDPRDTALLDDAGGLPETSGPVSSMIKLTSHEPEHLSVSVQMSRDALVVFSEIDYPGWVCTIDGQPTRIHRANDILRAVWVPKGQHTVEMRFVPRSFYVGAAITLCFALGLGLIAGWRFRRESAAPARDPRIGADPPPR